MLTEMKSLNPFSLKSRLNIGTDILKPKVLKSDF